MMGVLPQTLEIPLFAFMAALAALPDPLPQRHELPAFARRIAAVVAATSLPAPPDDVASAVLLRYDAYLGLLAARPAIGQLGSLHAGESSAVRMALVAAIIRTPLHPSGDGFAFDCGEFLESLT